jgi:hypothetical protein
MGFGLAFDDNKIAKDILHLGSLEIQDNVLIGSNTIVNKGTINNTIIKNNVKMDFIYIDGSHLLLDCYADLILSWQILEKEGILVIDDYLYKKKNTLDSPYEAVNHFLKNYEGKYKLLDKNYRVFLQKL